MKFGYFDDARREYVITTPATPLPWINYLGSEDFLGMISNTAGGYCFYRDAKLQRILRYRYNAVPGDNGGRLYYREAAHSSHSMGSDGVSVSALSYRAASSAPLPRSQSNAIFCWAAEE